MIHGSRDRSNGLVTFPRSQMIDDLLDDLIRPAPGGRILFSGHNCPRNQSGPRRREGGPIMDRRDSVEALAEFKVACDLWLPQLNERDRDKASTHVNSMFEKLRNSRGSPGQAA
jgi:hypothetical protein